MSDDDLLSALPLELQLYIVEAVPVGERCDRAALALASPHLLAACREQLPSYQGLEVAIAFHLVLGGTIDEQLLRRYARRSEATPEGCDWLAGAAVEGVAAATGPQILVKFSSDAEPGESRWYFTQPDSTADTLLRAGEGGATGHYEGEAGSEHLVCFETSCGTVAHFEGEKGAERTVRLHHPSGGDVSHFEGEKGAERIVRFEEENGNVAYYEGERGVERAVRLEQTSGHVAHFEGEKGAERMVRLEHTSGVLAHLEGERGAERTVRLEQTSSGDVAHFEGERGAERQVRYEPSYGGLLHIKGERGAGRPTRYELPYGGVIHFGGVTNVKRPMRETDAGRVMRIYG